MDQNKNPNCHICGSTSSFLMNKEEYPLYKCPKCGLVFLYPMLDESYLKDEVYSAKSGYQGNKKGDLHESMLPDRFDRILNFIGNAKDKKILDVGASNGEFLYLARKNGLDVYGVEINPKTANAGIRAGLNIFIGFLNDAKYPDNFFDYIHLGDLIEHVSDPRSILKECRRVLKSDGRLIIRTPNLDCSWARITFIFYRLFGTPWSVVTPPHHVYQFSFSNLNLLANQNDLIAEHYWFEKPPPLMYELGSLHLIRRYKKSRKLSDLIFAYFSFGLYAIFHFMDSLLTPFKKKDNSMTLIYRPKSK